VNFYKHHIGDYDQATRHLSFVEDAAYSRLIRKYYAEEKSLPADLRMVEKLIVARTKEERTAVRTILEEFFTLEADGWHNKRCDEEIKKATLIAETNQRIAQEREARKRERSGHVLSTKRAPNEHEACADEEHEACKKREPSQTPDTRLQTPDSYTPHPQLGAQPKSHNPKTTSILPPGFLRFWQAWPAHPRKTSRSACAKVWGRQNCEAIADHIVGIVEASKRSPDWTRDQGRFIPAPLVWLNQARWDTEQENLTAETALDAWPDPLKGSTRPPTEEDAEAVWGADEEVTP